MNPPDTPGASHGAPSHDALEAYEIFEVPEEHLLDGSRLLSPKDS
ncbi:hypothetical protein [Corynebacterium endometrii]|nr:hypothetical protein [Corynebacterium endometrii]